MNGTIVIETLSNVRYTGHPAFSAGSGAVSLFRLVDSGKYADRVRWSWVTTQ